MTKLIIIRTEADNNQLLSFLRKEHINYEIYQEPAQDKLRTYIKKKAQENIFANYGEALKDKELEAEKTLLENDLE